MGISLLLGGFRGQAGYVVGVGEHRSDEPMTPAACAAYTATVGAKGWSMAIAALNDPTFGTIDFCHYYMCGFDSDEASQLTITDDDYYYDGNTFAFCDRQAVGGEYDDLEHDHRAHAFPAVLQATDP